VLQSRGLTTILACQVIKNEKKKKGKKNNFGKLGRRLFLCSYRNSKSLIIENCGEIYNEIPKSGGSWQG